MTELDLEALSAPVESMRSEVAAAYDQLNKQWDEVATALKKLSLPLDVACMYWHDSIYGTERNACLEWRRWKGTRRLCVVEYSELSELAEIDVTPYEEWSGEQRLTLLQHVPELFERAAEITRDFVDRSHGKQVSK